MDGAVAEDGHPEKDKKGWGEEHPHHELPNGPAPGNTRDEHPYEGRPGHPPSPVEKGPAPQPLVGLVGKLAEGEGHQLGGVGPHVL